MGLLQNLFNPFISVMEAGSEENQMDSHNKKTFIALIVASSALAVTLLVLLSLWIHKRYSQKPHKSNAHSSGISPFFQFGFLGIDDFAPVWLPRIVLLGM